MRRVWCWSRGRRYRSRGRKSQVEYGDIRVRYIGEDGKSEILGT